MQVSSTSSSRDGADRKADIRLPLLGSPARGSTKVKPSRAAVWRALVLLTIQILIIVHVIQWLMTGTTLSPLEPSESMETVRQGVINAGAVLFVLALLSTMIFGRWFCGWGCHIVMLQDFCGWLLKRVGIRPRPFRARLLMFVPLALALYMFVWPAVYRWGVVPLGQSLHQWFPDVMPAPRPVPPWPGFTLELQTDDFWRSFPGVVIAVPFLFICGFATVYFLGAKGFCTYGCPYGGFFAPLDQFARGRIRVTDACRQCGHCTAVCTSNVRVHEEVHEFGMVVDPGCMKCMDCVSVCPSNALYYGFGPASSKRTSAQESSPRASRRSRWDLSWREEVALISVFLLVFFGLRGVYGLVPMLMAGGIAICVSFMAWKSWRMAFDANVSFHRARLKVRGKIAGSGVMFGLVTVGILLLAVHSLAVRTIHWSADRLDGQVLVSREMVFVRDPVVLDGQMRSAAERSLSRYAMIDTIGSGGIALLPTPGVDVRRAWLSACLHDFEGAEQLMLRHMDRFGPADEVARDVALLKQLQGRPAEAEAYLRTIIAENPRFIRSTDYLVDRMIREGRIVDAIESMHEALRALALIPPSPRMVRRMNEARLHILRRAALLEADWGDRERAVTLLRESITIDSQNSIPYAILAILLVDLDQLDEAEEVMRHALGLANDPEPLIRQMAEALEAGGHAEVAARWRASAAGRTP